MLDIPILAAALVIAPQPNVQAQIGPQDYPQAHLEAEHSAAALLEFVVSPDGKIENCRVLSFVGNEALTKAMCRLERQSSWRVARDGDGNPAYGVVRTLFKMTIPGTVDGDRITRMSQASDVELTVQRLPAGISSPFDVKVELKVDQSGAVQICQPNSDAVIPSALAKIACDQAMGLKMGPVSGRSGPLPGFIIEQKVRFVASQSVPATSN